MGFLFATGHAAPSGDYLSVVAHADPSTPCLGAVRVQRQIERTPPAARRSTSGTGSGTQDGSGSAANRSNLVSRGSREGGPQWAALSRPGAPASAAVNTTLRRSVRGGHSLGRRADRMIVDALDKPNEAADRGPEDGLVPSQRFGIDRLGS